MCDSYAARPALFEGGTGIFSGAAEVALFDGDQQVTEWQPYDPDANTPVRAPRTVVRPALVLRRQIDQLELVRQATWMICPEGDSVSFPHPDTWTIQAM